MSEKPQADSEALVGAELGLKARHVMEASAQPRPVSQGGGCRCGRHGGGHGHGGRGHGSHGHGGCGCGKGHRHGAASSDATQP